MKGYVIAGIPADNPANRAHAARLGTTPDPWPVPYKSSVLMDCGMCEGQAWVGPELQKARTAAINKGGNPLVLCLFCAALATVSGGITVIGKLTDKKAGE